MERVISLSKRMQAAADLVSQGKRVCDVGCDHGYVSIYLVQSGKSPRVLAMDVRRGPLLRAEEHVHKYRAEDYITLRLSDGLSAYRAGEADTLLCAGMGGRLMMEILEKDREKTADFEELVLQPQSELPLFRKFLRENGYRFIEERMVFEEGKFYPLMKVARSSGLSAKRTRESEKLCRYGKLLEEGEETVLGDLLGPLLLKERDPYLLRFVQKEIRTKKEILDRLGRDGARHQGRVRELTGELSLLEKAEALWGM